LNIIRIKNFNLIILIILKNKKKGFIIYLMGIGDWGLGIGDWAQSPIPNPQSPIPNPQSPLKTSLFVLNNL